MTLEQIRRIDWEGQRFNAFPFFIDNVATHDRMALPWGLSYTHFLCISRGDNIEVFYDRDDFRRIGKTFWKKVKTVADLEKVIATYEKEYARTAKAAAYEEGVLAKLSAEGLVALLDKQSRRIYGAAGDSHIIEAASFVAEQKLRELGIDPHSIHPSSESFLKRAEAYARELCASKRSDAEIVAEFRKRFAWIQSSYLGRNELSIGAIHDLAAHAHAQGGSAAFATSAPAPKAVAKDKDFIAAISRMFSWQDERKAHILESIYAAEPVLYATARAFDIPKESIRFMLPQETDKLDDPSFKKELAKRTAFFFNYVPRDLKRILLTGAEAEKEAAHFDVFLQHSGEIKGKPAFAGKATGKVRVCLSLESIQAFRPGEILVASMTRPEYLPAMKKAAAFVTDEGGITCHAAIIAREMSKPCVVGTKAATKALKDGDMVEVDANKGTIKIL